MRYGMWIMPKIIEKKKESEFRAAKPKDKPYKIIDEGGLRMIVHPSGTKVWQYAYSLKGKQDTYTIGWFTNSPSPISLRKARAIRDEKKSLVQQGIDPKVSDKEAVADENLSFKAIALEWYAKQNWAEKHAKNILSRIEKDVFPHIGAMTITKIKVPQIVTMLKSIEERGALDVARRINGYCTQIFEYAINLGICEMNPAQGRASVLQSRAIENRKHMKEEELPAFFENLYADNDSNIGKHLAHIGILTLLRPTEYRDAKWEEIDFDKAVWTIPAERMKPKKHIVRQDHIVPLSKQAMNTLAKLREVTGSSTYLFPGNRWNKSLSDVSHIKKVKAYSNSKSTPHGFRHTASTILNEQGYNYDWIERQLDHIDKNKVRGTYNKAEYLDQRAKMMQDWADYLDALKG